MPAQQLRNGALAQPVLAAQRVDDPGLLDLAQLVMLVKCANDGGRCRFIERQHPRTQARPAQPLCGSPALEAVDELQAIAVGERDHGGQLSVLLQRAAHALVGRRLAQPQPAQSLDELVERNLLQLL